jgi:hypothetical protein
LAVVFWLSGPSYHGCTSGHLRPNVPL